MNFRFAVSPKIGRARILGRVSSVFPGRKILPARRRMHIQRACIIIEVVGHRSFVNDATRAFRGLGAYVKDRVYGPCSENKRPNNAPTRRRRAALCSAFL